VDCKRLNHVSDFRARAGSYMLTGDVSRKHMGSATNLWEEEILRYLLRFGFEFSVGQGCPQILFIGGQVVFQF
jgi:hypothetical protein